MLAWIFDECREGRIPRPLGRFKLDAPLLAAGYLTEEADAWRPEVWRMIKERTDLDFVVITKRIHRFRECIPHDWGMAMTM